MRGTTEERFWAKVDKSGDCWLWRGAARAKGYGTAWDTRSGTGRIASAHRLSYEMAHGPIPEGMTVDHFTCFNPRCVRPDHLRLLTRSDNSKQRRIRDCCKRGHSFTAENTFISNGGRQCRECHRRRSVESRARARAKAAS